LQYALTTAKFYHKKFTTLAKVFIQTIKTLRWEADKVHKQNADLNAQLKQLQTDSANMHARTFREHAQKTTEYEAMKKEHESSVVKAAEQIDGVRAELMREKSTKLALQKELDDLNAKIRDLEEKNKHDQEESLRVAKANADAAEKNRQVLEQIGNVNQQLDDVNTRIKSLEAVLKALTEQRRQLQLNLDQLNSAKQSTEREQQRIQASYNSLNARLAEMNKGHLTITQGLQGEIDGLKKQIAEQRKRCIPDACGVCNGDESTCALTRTAGTCYSVGDPHLRTFDGISYDYQNNGQFLYAWHGNPVNFEMQMMQRNAWANSWPRYIKGLAVRGGRDIVIVYTEWFTDAILVNGVRTVPPQGQWQRVAPGLTVYKANREEIQIRYEAHGQIVTVVSRPHGSYMDVYLTAPWQWSSGRSLFGLCGDFDTWNGNDNLWIQRNNNRLFVVSETGRDMFKFPQRRTSFLELVDHTPEEIAAERHWDKVNGVAAPEDLQVYSGAELAAVPDTNPAVPAPDTAPNAAAAATAAMDDDPRNLPKADTQPKVPNPLTQGKPKEADPLSKVSLGPATPNMRKEARHRCRGSHGQARRQCMIDVLMGVPGARARHIFQAANLLSKEKCLKRCMRLDEKHFALFPASELPAMETAKEGISIAFWWNADMLPAKRCIMIERGRDFFCHPARVGSFRWCWQPPLHCKGCD